MAGRGSVGRCGRDDKRNLQLDSTRPLHGLGGKRPTRISDPFLLDLLYFRTSSRADSRAQADNMGAAQSARAEQGGADGEGSGEAEFVDYYELLAVSTACRTSRDY